MQRDADGVARYTVRFSIEGKGGTRSGEHHGAHEQEVARIRRQVQQEARKGDTVTVKVI